MEDMSQAWTLKQMSNEISYHMHTNQVLTHFFQGLDYNSRVLINSAVGGKALEKNCEQLFGLIDRLVKGNPGYEREMPRTKTQRAAKYQMYIKTPI